MSIVVVIRNERGEAMADAPTMSFQNIVSWDNSSRFPLLGDIDPMGLTVYNRLQVKVLISELETIRDSIEHDGVAATITDLGSDQVEQSQRIVNWDLERNLPGLVTQLLDICGLSLKRYHHYLWFLGD